MNIEDLTIKQARELASLFSVGQVPTQTGHPLVGKNCIVRTVTMIYTGRMVEANATEFVLVDCSWIPETGRYMQFVADGNVKECEPFPDGLPVYINRGALMECCELVKPLPRSQK